METKRLEEEIAALQRELLVVQRKYIALLEDRNIVRRPRPVTRDEVLWMKKMAADNVPVLQIAELVGRPRATVHWVLAHDIDEALPEDQGGEE